MTWMQDKSPEQLAEEVFTRKILGVVRWLFDHGSRYLSRFVLTLVGGGLVGVVVGVISLPIVAAVICGVVVVVSVGYAVFAHMLLDDERVTRRWAFVDRKRLQQKLLAADRRLDEAVLAIMDEPEDRGIRVRAQPAELGQVLALIRYRTAEIRAAQHPQPRRAGVRRPAAPQEPDLGVVRARIAERQAEHDALEAEIQSLPVPEDIDAAMAADEARKYATSARDAAHEATFAARDRKRHGRPATQQRPSPALQVRTQATGERTVRRVVPEPTPEQIAQGLGKPPAKPSD